MTYTRRATSSILAALALFCGALVATEARSRAQSGLAAGGDSAAVSTIRKRVDEVNLFFTVHDKKGRFVSNLRGDEIQVLDDRQPPESVRYFQQQTDLPLRVGLLVDVSSSVFYRFSLEKKAATAFLQKVLRPNSDSAFVAGFDTRVHMAQDLTDNATLLSKAVRTLSPSGDTALYDAVRYACEQVSQQREVVPARRVIILFTDGMDNSSHASLADAIETALRSEVAIYALSINPPEDDFNRPGEKALQRLTQATGGRLLPAYTPRKAGKAFDSIQRELRSQYVIAYKPANLVRDGRYRAIQLRTSKKRLRVHCRKGYYVSSDP